MKREINIRLHAIYSIKSLVKKQTQRATGIHPRRTVLVQRRVIPQHREEINYHEEKARESNLPFHTVQGLLSFGHCDALGKKDLQHWACIAVSTAQSSFSLLLLHFHSRK